ncbi:MAG: hypothetical protein ACYCVH_12380 [Ignavibacteriaceae bacterium]
MKNQLLFSQKSRHGLIRLKKFTSNSGLIHYEILIYHANGSLSVNRFNNYAEAISFFRFLIPKKSTRQVGGQSSFFNLL